MFQWRITKYDPKWRDNEGAFLKNEWTSFSDIDLHQDDYVGSDNNKKLTLQEYIKVENAYVEAISLFMDCLNISYLFISALEKYNKVDDWLKNLKTGNRISKKTINLLIRATLREEIWCTMKYDDIFFVHFGYDYYMYIGSNKPCNTTLESIKKLGLFVEPFESPYKM